MGYKSGIIVQTTGELEDDFDYEAMKEADDRQRRSFASFRDELAREYPNLLALGNGSCNVCPACAYPDPCRNPLRAISSMEAFGLVVSDVCTKNGVGYYYGPRTITYTGCYLLI
jgi:predicted metal-binding protein